MTCTDADLMQVVQITVHSGALNSETSWLYLRKKIQS